MSGLVLSLFPGIGLFDMAFEEEGFCVVRGPDLLWGGDVRTFHPPAGRFDGVIGGPPCQRFSQLAHIVRHVHGEDALAPDLIPEFSRIIMAARPEWYVMENVPAAPRPVTLGYAVRDQIVRDHWCGGETSRERRFCYGGPGRFEIATVALHRLDPLPAVTTDAREIPVAVGGSGKRKPTESGGRTSCLNRGIPCNGPTGGWPSRALPLEEMAARQGVPAERIAALTEHGAFKVDALRRGVGNGVPLAMGRAVARAVKRATSPQDQAA